MTRTETKLSFVYDEPEGRSYGINYQMKFRIYRATINPVLMHAWMLPLYNKN